MLVFLNQLRNTDLYPSNKGFISSSPTMTKQKDSARFSEIRNSCNILIQTYL